MNVWKWSHEDGFYHRGHVRRLCDRCPKVRTCSYESEIINVKELMRLIEKEGV